MDSGRRVPVIGLFTDEPLVRVDELRLRGAPAHHARVRRAGVGEGVRVVDGQGNVASGEILAAGKDELTVSIARIDQVPRPSTLEVIVPVADRDRMLLAAEKAVELQVTAWRPVYFARSRSVSTRGEGTKFREKVRARMQSALEQCGGAWLPDLHDEAEGADVLKGMSQEWKRLLLDATGSPLATLVVNGPMAIAVGPEGGLEREEIAAAEESGWLLSSLGHSTLRFETAVIAGSAVIRATQLSHRS